MSIDKQTIRDFLRRLINPNMKIGDDDLLIEAGLLDSLAMAQFLNFIESRYKVTFDNDDLIPENFESINAIVSFLAQKGA